MSDKLDREHQVEELREIIESYGSAISNTSALAETIMKWHESKLEDGAAALAAFVSEGLNEFGKALFSSLKHLDFAALAEAQAQLREKEAEER